MMKRRKFVKTTSVASIALSTMPMLGCSAIEGKKIFSLNHNLRLKGFNDEQEESPSLVTDGNGQMWMYALRRISYPENAELISAFHFDGKNWTEKDAVSKYPGQYEAPVAICATGGKPVVSWVEIEDEDWVINVAMMKANGMSDPYTFSVQSGRSINPVLIAPDINRNWIAWENLHDGKFTIYISKYENGQWSEPVIIDKGESSCFDPGIVEAINGDLYIAYGLTDGFHQNIEMSIIDSKTLRIKESIPVAIGGGHIDRVNINARPALAFDAQDNLWISYENNRNASRTEDGDNYTGDRCCTILSYQNGRIVEVKDNEKCLFNGENDHKPSFFKDQQGHLFLATSCGGNFEDAQWRYRITWLDPKDGWQQPVTFFETGVKGMLIPPTIAFDQKGNFWFSTCLEKTDKIKRTRLSELKVMQFTAPEFSKKHKAIDFSEAQIEEYRPDENSISQLSGHPRMKRRQMTVDGEIYTLILGNLHEHSNSSHCWPAGTDGTLHEDYRFGMFSEGYDFVGMTDHAASSSEIHWRRNIRIADFYNESEKFIAIPAVEWTLQSNPKQDEIQHGAGHYNIIFASSEDAGKYIRNKHEIYCPNTPETKIAPMLWKMLDEKEISCVTIPHHPADKMHPTDWNVTDPKYVTVVEIFQCRGNNEYPGCPRERNLSRHTPTLHKHAYVDYALKTKKYKMGFIASGDHNSMGIGLAALWVKEVSRKGIIEALQNRRSFATTGDKMVVDMKVNEAIIGATSTENKVPEIVVSVSGQHPLENVEILRNSKVIHKIDIGEDTVNFTGTYTDRTYKDEKEVLYYYIRTTQKNKEIAWSSPVWVERT
ncbi:MAG: DUF3604 domain-containing protein [Candidatus Heimdallarchaeota archaeon]|nr:DUF3604 domain-containing protein [Candidatus Heimdallarchaeota archaeon]